MENNGGTRKRGQSAVTAGAIILFVGIAFALTPNFSGLGILAAIAGFVTLLIGSALGREEPAD